MKKILLSLLCMSLLSFSNPQSIKAHHSNIENVQTYVLKSNDEIIETDSSAVSFGEKLNYDVITIKTIQENSGKKDLSQSQAITVSHYFLNEEQSRMAQSATLSEGVLYYSAVARATINYDTIVSDFGIKYGVLKSASGYISNLDSGVQILRQSIVLGTCGSCDGNPWLDQSTSPMNVVGLNWGTYYGGANWKYVSMISSHLIGVTNTITLKHGSTTYTDTIQFSV